MKIDLTGRTAVITGGSRGLGEAMARRWPRRARGLLWWRVIVSG